MDPNVLRLAMGAAGAGAEQNRLYFWGLNNSGRLGLGNTTDYSSPKQVGSLTTWEVVSSGNGSSAIKSDGTLWSWGSNANGQLGLGNTTNYSSPKQVGSLTNWSKIYQASSHALAIKTDGTLWSWGFNHRGQLGLLNTTNYSSPKQIGSGTNWKQAACSLSHSHAIKTDGTLWSWGLNDFGQLGLNDLSDRSTPTQVGTGTDWNLVVAGRHHSMAIKTNGTLWALGGYNSSGALGLYDTVDRSSPVQVGSATNWSKVVAGQSNTFAIKTDGTIWSWGRNNIFGELGQYPANPYNTNVSSPVQIGSLTNWLDVVANYQSVVAIKTNNTLWSWGRNDFGQLGLNDTTDRSSPVQIGSLTNWKSVSAPTGGSGLVGAAINR